MKTPWSDWLKYGVGTATLLVISAAGLILFAMIGLAVVVSKILAFIK